MPSQFILQQAARHYQSGDIIAYPTESVYGLGCDPLDPLAIERLLKLKNRPLEKGLILLTDSIDKLMPFIELSTQQQSILQQSAAITWLVKASPFTPPWITGRHQKVAVRITQHPVARRLCEQLSDPVVSTSANPSQRNAAKNSLQLRQYFNRQIDFIVPGECGQLSRPTRIIDIDNQKIYRP